MKENEKEQFNCIPAAKYIFLEIREGYKFAVKTMTPQEIQERRHAMFNLVEEYLASGQSLLSFSKLHNIPKSTFQSWHKKYLAVGIQKSR